MRSIKMLSLAALAALLAMAFVGAGSAMAESTTLCSSEAETCEAISHVHETSVGKGKLKSELPTIECTVLFLGDTEVGTSAPLVINGAFTYSSCNNFCTVKEENGPAKLKVLRTGEELASVTGEGLVHVSCPFINCNYIGTGLEGHVKGPLKSTQANGEVSLTEQNTEKESGSCPEEAFLTLTTTPLEATYITTGLHYCVDYEHGNNGFYANSHCTERATSQVKLYELVVAPKGFALGEVLCVNKRTKIGLWKVRNLGICEEDNKVSLNAELYEKGTITLVK